MGNREYRRFTAEQKLEILREANQPGVTVSEVCRRRGLAPSVLYRWRAVAQGGSAVALKRDAQRSRVWTIPRCATKRNWNACVRGSRRSRRRCTASPALHDDHEG